MLKVHLALFVVCLIKASFAKYILDDSYRNNSRQLTFLGDLIQLQDLAALKGIYFGAVTNIVHLQDPNVSPSYNNLLGSMFSLTTAENSCKWTATEPSQNIFDFGPCDYVKANALALNQTFRGHNLCWGRYNPDWLTNGNFSSNEMESILTNHIDRVLKYYGASVPFWDVVNEALADDFINFYKPNMWFQSIQNYVDIAFLQAGKSRSPGVKLFYNDYFIESSEGWNAHKSDNMYKMVKSMLERKIPIDGVGFEMHVDIYYNLANGVKANMERLGSLGLDVHITELDVSCAWPLDCPTWGLNEETMQAEVYAALLQACLDAKACKSFEMWGLTDLYTWKGTGQHPLPFDENYLPKLAYQAMLDTLLGNTTWVEAYYTRISSHTMY